MGRPSIDWSIPTLLEHTKPNTSGCWEWQRGMGSNGYGTVRFRGVSVAAHRMAWTLASGEIPAGMCVLHKCDNRRCCRPEHLFLGTQYDNNKDRDLKGRQRAPRGAANGNAKLDEEGVRLIRALWLYGFSQDAIGKLFGVPQGYVSHVVTRKVWAHVV